MAQITWRNIDAPRFAESAAMYESAGRQLTDAFKGISGAAQELEATQVRDNTNRYLMGALQAQDAEQLSAFMQGEGAGILAAAGTNIDPSALLQTQGVLDGLISRKTNQLNQGVLEQNIGATGALNQYAHEASLGNTVSPEILAQALQHQQFSSVAPVINQGNLQRELSAAQHADDMRIKQQQLAQQAGQNAFSNNLNTMKFQLELSKVLEEQGALANSQIKVGDQTLGSFNTKTGIPSLNQQGHELKNSIARMSRPEQAQTIAALEAVNPTLAQLLMEGVTGANTNLDNFSKGIGLEPTPQDKLFTASELNNSPNYINDALKDVPGIDKHTAGNLAKALNAAVKSGYIPPDAQISRAGLQSMFNNPDANKGWIEGLGSVTRGVFESLFGAFLPASAQKSLLSDYHNMYSQYGGETANLIDLLLKNAIVK